MGTNLERTVEEGIIDKHQSDKLLEAGRSMYYPDRSYHAAVKKVVESGFIPSTEQDAIIVFLVDNEVDVKREDALLVIKKIVELAGSR